MDHRQHEIAFVNMFPGHSLSLLFTCGVKAWWEQTGWAPEARLRFALVLAIFAESLQSPEERTPKKNTENTKKKKVLKGKKRKRKGGGEERAGPLSSNGSYAKKQLTKNRLNREGKWGKNKMVWSQADKCTRKKFTWFWSSTWHLSQNFVFVYVYVWFFIFVSGSIVCNFFLLKKMSYFPSFRIVQRAPLSPLKKPTSSDFI